MRKQDTIEMLMGLDEVLEKEIKKFGLSSGHIIVHKKHVGKVAKILVKKNLEEDRK